MFKGYELYNSKICKGVFFLKMLYGKFFVFSELVIVVCYVCGGEFVIVVD